MIALAIANRKGGVAKTTTAFELAAALAQQGKRVLSVDFDPQGSLTRLYGYDPQPGFTEALRGNAAPTVCPTNTGGLLPVSVDLASAEAGGDHQLKGLLPRVPGYDFAIIDTPPALGYFTRNALTAAGAVVLPVQPDTLSLAEAVKMLKTVEAARQYTNPQLLAALLLCEYEPRRILSGEAEEAYKGIASEAGAVFLGHIRRSADIRKAQARKRPVISTFPKSPAAVDYQEATEALLSLFKRTGKET